MLNQLIFCSKLPWVDGHQSVEPAMVLRYGMSRDIRAILILSTLCYCVSCEQSMTLNSNDPCHMICQLYIHWSEDPGQSNVGRTHEKEYIWFIY